MTPLPSGIDLTVTIWIDQKDVDLVYASDEKRRNGGIFGDWTERYKDALLRIKGVNEVTLFHGSYVEFTPKAKTYEALDKEIFRTMAKVHRVTQRYAKLP